MNPRLLQLLKNDIERSTNNEDLTTVQIDPRLDDELTALAADNNLPNLTDDDVDLLEAMLADIQIPEFIQKQVDAAWRTGKYKIASLGLGAGASISGIQVGIQFRKTDTGISDNDHRKASEAIEKFREDLRKASQKKG